eukprot:9290636-Lingulodinium_polyedra.AAC.1
MGDAASAGASASSATAPLPLLRHLLLWHLHERALRRQDWGDRGRLRRPRRAPRQAPPAACRG